jgi:predicted O-methyltransferase YrrM
MNRKTGLVLLLSALAVIAVSSQLLCGPPQISLDAAKNPVRKIDPGPKEITIRNVTKAEVRYTIQGAEAGAKNKVRKLAAGAIDRFPATQTVTVTYQKDGRDVSYSLYPGRPYSFRYDRAGALDIYQGSHGRADAEDLAPWVPTPPEVIVKMLDMAGVNKDSVVYDIGCGDGRIVLYAALAFKARGVGIDIDPVRIDECKANAKRDKVEHLVKFLLGDATKMDISKATVVALYLLPESNELLRPKFEKNLKPGTLVVSHNYVVPGWESKEIGTATVIDLEKTEHSVFLYRK